LKQLINIIDEHFLSNEREEILSLFQKYGIDEIIVKVSKQLNEGMEKAINGNPLLPLISSTSSNFLVSVNSQVVKITDPIEKRNVQEFVAKFSIRALLSIVKLFPEDVTNIFDAVQQSIRLTAEMFGFDYSDISNLMQINLDDFSELTQSLRGNKYAKEIQKLNVKHSKQLVWTHKTKLDFLTYELQKAKWLKKRREFECLFHPPKTSKGVHWNMEYKYELAYLIYVLAKEDFIRPKKGCFSISEQILRDYNGNLIGRNSLKKMSSAITNNPDKYHYITDKIDKMITTIMK